MTVNIDFISRAETNWVFVLLIYLYIYLNICFPLIFIRARLKIKITIVTSHIIPLGFHDNFPSLILPNYNLSLSPLTSSPISLPPVTLKQTVYSPSGMSVCHSAASLKGVCVSMTDSFVSFMSIHVWKLLPLLRSDLFLLIREAACLLLVDSGTALLYLNTTVLSFMFLSSFVVNITS